MSDDKKPNPDDAPIVTSLDEITADGPVLWTSDAMATQGVGAIFAIPDDGNRGSWREPWPSAEGKPMHMLSAPIVTRPTPPTDAEIVALMKLRGNGTREQPRSSEIGTPVGLAWRGVAIPEADAQAAWDRFHATPKHPTRVIYHHDPASLPAELHAQYEVRPCPPPSDPTFLADSALGGVDSHTLPLPLPEALNRPGRLVRDDAACGWRFEPAV